MDADLERWLADAPRLECDWEPLTATYRRSLVDLAALRFSPLIAGGRSLPAAGLPWFMTMFGRDSIFTSLQALPFAPELAATTLRELGAAPGHARRRLPRRGPGPDPARDALRRDDRVRGAAALALLRHAPTPPRCSSCCSTSTSAGPATRKLVRELEHEARAALRWIDEYADLQGNGYISYQRRNEETGLENQCWKDSWDSISYRDGRLPGFPRATCELQGYAYDAKVRGARLARDVWHDAGLRRPARAARPPTSSAASTATSGSRTASTSRSPSTPTAARSTR